MLPICRLFGVVAATGAGDFLPILLVGLVVVVIVVFAISLIAVYNELDPLRHKINEAAANLEVVMHKRIEVTNRLVDIAGRYARHEKLIHLKVSGNRAAAGQAALSPFRQASQAVTFIAALADNFPALKADQTYLRLMNDLPGLESEIQSRYEAYNGLVRDYNTKLTSFPTLIFVKLLPFKEKHYLDPFLWYPSRRSPRAAVPQPI